MIIMLEYILVPLQEIGVTILVLSVCGSVAYYLPLFLRESYLERKRSHKHYEIMRESKRKIDSYENQLAKADYMKKMVKLIEENKVNE